jgi:hypothetical protein
MFPLGCGLFIQRCRHGNIAARIHSFCSHPPEMEGLGGLGRAVGMEKMNISLKLGEFIGLKTQARKASTENSFR